jgi:membrane-associated phospholipid phosphatase
MTDPLQQALHTAAAHSAPLAAIAVFCANLLLFVLAGALAALGMGRLRQITWGLAARVALSLGVATLLTLLSKAVIDDPRPYLAEHYTPLAHAAADNGFPSDHTLVAALLAGWAWWLDRRLLPVFVAGTMLVLLGRLAIGAHHTLDVLGSLGFALAGLLLAARLLRPGAHPGWASRLLLPGRR